MANKKKRGNLSTKITLMFMILLVIVMAAIGFVTYRTRYESVLNDYNSIGESAGKIAADIIDPSCIDGWLKNGADETYDKTYQLLTGVKRANALSYLYVSLPCFDEAGNMVNDSIYLFDVMIEGEDPSLFSALGDHSGEGDMFEPCRYLYENNVSIKSDVITETEFGWLLTVMVPLCGSDGNPVGWIGVDIDMTDLMASILRQTVITVSLIFALITVFAVIFIIYFRSRVVAPVRELSTQMNNFVRNTDNLDYKPYIPKKTNDEIEQMSEDFSSMAKSILDYTVNLEKTTAEKERMRADLDVAANIRASLSGCLSYPAFPDRTDFEMYASMKNTVFNKSSFCDCFFTDENHLFLVIGEASGRSLASMLSAMLAATNIRCFARMGYQPYRIAMETNNQLAQNRGDNRELTVAAQIAQIDLKSGVMKYVNAGMPPMLLKETGAGFAFDSRPAGFLLGEMPGVSFTQDTRRLSQGNTILLMSGGVPKMKNENGLEFTNAYVQSGINMIAAREYDLKAMTELLEHMLDGFRGNAELEADTSLLLFRYFG
ncbi:MAG: HAMP domain-containing protein [Ruminococcaceae bacterium]|nr:HAMP domain-containing protein [Oscillospiraceae bacterium]